jgi:preprotein translocase SecE subunit
MEKLRLFFDEYYNELAKHVTWPRADELQNNTVLVLVAALVVAIAIALLDFIFSGALRSIDSLFQ